MNKIRWKHSFLMMGYIAVLQVVINLVIGFAVWKWLFSWSDVRYVIAACTVVAVATVGWNKYQDMRK